MPKITHKTAPRRTAKPTPQTPHADERPNTMEADLIQLIDDVAEFADISAFICHALAVSLSEQEQPNKKIISGARICSGWLQTKSAAIQEGLSDAHDRYVAEHKKEFTT